MPDQFKIIDLLCEGLTNPLGVDVNKPRLSWKMNSRSQGAFQSAYRVLCATDESLLSTGQADLWDSAKVLSPESQHIRYSGKPVPQGTTFYWSVKIWDENGDASDWSKPSFWTHFNLQKDADWHGKWITTPHSSPWMRHTFDLKLSPKRAFIYINGLGYYRLYINGVRIGDDEFSPHVGQYNQRTFCNTYDVAQYLRSGSNNIGIWMGSGWNKDGAGVSTEPCLRAQLDMLDSQGHETSIGTNPSWKTHPSSHSYLGKWCWNQFGGEEHHAGHEIPDWAELSYDDSDWDHVTFAERPNLITSSTMLQPSRIIENLQPISTSNIEPGVWLIDMGKAMTGTTEIRLPSGPKEHRVTLEFGDHYEEATDSSLGTLNHFNQISSYVYRGYGDEVFKNIFNYASFRYILIKNTPAGPISTTDVQGHFISTDLEESGSFECSNDTLNGIHHMMKHTLKCLMLGGYQVDCHSRERYGYGGDGQSSLDTTLCLFRSDTLYRKWTNDWLDGQKEDGELTYTSPASGHGGGPFWCGFLPASTLKHHLHYGDDELVFRNYPAIKKWLELAQSKTNDGTQEQFCGGWFLGDWASPENIEDKDNANIFIQFYMVYILKQAAQLAEVVGESNDAKTFLRWAQERSTVAHQKFYHPDSKHYGSGDQITYILPLISEAHPECELDHILSNYETSLMDTHKGHLTTGLSGTYLMIQYLQSIERHDLIFNFASKKSYPSWGYMLANGATATWEHWEGIRSRIHNCYNNIGSWFIQGLVGIRPDPEIPGFKNFIIKPAFIDNLDYAKGSHSSLYGQIESSWKRKGKALILEILIPANTTAVVHLPAKTEADLSVNENSLENEKHVTLLSIEKEEARISVLSGRYIFKQKV